MKAIVNCLYYQAQRTGLTPRPGTGGNEVGKKSARRVKRAWAAPRGSGNEQPSPPMTLDDTCRYPDRSTVPWPPGEPHSRPGRFEVDRGATVPAGRAVEAQPRARGSCSGRQWRRYGQAARGHDERPARRATDQGRRSQHREPRLTCFGE